MMYALDQINITASDMQTLNDAFTEVYCTVFLNIIFSYLVVGISH